MRGTMICLWEVYSNSFNPILGTFNLIMSRTKLLDKNCGVWLQLKRMENPLNVEEDVKVVWRNRNSWKHNCSSKEKYLSNFSALSFAHHFSKTLNSVSFSLSHYSSLSCSSSHNMCLQLEWISASANNWLFRWNMIATSPNQLWQHRNEISA